MPSERKEILIDNRWLACREDDGAWEVCDAGFGNLVIGHAKTIDGLWECIEAGKAEAIGRAACAGCYAPSSRELEDV